MNARRPQSDTPMESDRAEISFDIESVTSQGDTHVGRVRRINQDDYGEWRNPKAQRHLIFVADGMGGHRGGEVASQMAVEEVVRRALAQFVLVLHEGLSTRLLAEQRIIQTAA